MNRKLVGIIFVLVLFILSTAQICIDSIFENSSMNKFTEVAKPAGYCIFIEIEDKTLYLLQDGKCIKQYPIASGKSGYPSPLGFWKIIQKSDWGEGFGGRWMGLNVPWGTLIWEHEPI